jgi:hypothetical protein
MAEDQGWRCSDHTAMVQSVGRIEGKLDSVLEGQEEFRGCLDKLTENGYRRDQDAAKERAEIVRIAKPYIWAKRILAGTLGAIGIILVQQLFPKIIKALAGAL